MSQTTKKALGESLKRILAHKTLDKITVKEIVEDCEVKRQTFYYHFHDIYSLLDWIFTTETAKILEGKVTFETWQDVFLGSCEYIIKNKDLVNNTYYSIHRELLKRYLYDVAYGLLYQVVKKQSEGMNISEENKVFVTNFYKYVFAGFVIEWISKGMKKDPKSMVDQIDTLINGGMKRALKKYDQTPMRNGIFS